MSLDAPPVELAPQSDSGFAHPDRRAFGKVLLVTEVFPPRTGGSGRWFWELYRRLPRESVVVAAGAYDGDKEFDSGHDLNVHRLPLKFPTWGLFSRAGLTAHGRALKRLSALVRRERPAMLHCGKCLPEGVLAWLLRRRTGLRYACYVHGEELTLARESRELKWLTRRALAGAAKVIANSRNTRQMLVDDWSLRPEKVEVLHPGVDTTKFVPAPRDAAARNRLGWGDRPVILTVGALTKRKGQDMLIRALPAIRERIPNVLYSIVGEGSYRSDLEKLVLELGVGEHVQFRGAPGDDDLVSCYQQCDLFALPNRRVGTDFEGFGIVFLEAQACGKPVLAGDSGGTSETLEPGVTGYVLDCETPDALIESICRLLPDAQAREAMGARGRQRATSQFDWTPLANQAEKLFRELAPIQ
jgi:phosphatidylinositol alpha-1,6-mannosyltransferase